MITSSFIFVSFSIIEPLDPKICISKLCYLRINNGLSLGEFHKWFSHHFYQSFYFIIFSFSFNLPSFITLYALVMCFRCFHALISVLDKRGTKMGKMREKTKNWISPIHFPKGFYGHPQQLLRAIAANVPFPIQSSSNTKIRDLLKAVVVVALGCSRQTRIPIFSFLF